MNHAVFLQCPNCAWLICHGNRTAQNALALAQPHHGFVRSRRRLRIQIHVDFHAHKVARNPCSGGEAPQRAVGPGKQFAPHTILTHDAGQERGMLFVFEAEQPLAFWMLNTITPLDIAYIRTDGKLVKIHTMPPLTTQTFPSVEPARYALEVRAGTFAKLGIAEGDQAEIPTSVLKR